MSKNADEKELKLILSHYDIEREVKRLSAEISKEYKNRDLVLIGVLKGAFIFLADLARNLTIPAEIDFVRLSSYGSETESSGDVQILMDIELSIDGKDVIVVEDIVDTGYTIEFLAEHLRRKKAASVKICVLLDKSERRKCQVSLDYVGFGIPRGFLVGYGLDCNEKYRNLKDVYEILLNS